MHMGAYKQKNKMDLEEKKTEEKCKVFDYQTENKLSYELMSFSVFEDSDGYLFAMMKDKENKPVVPKLICNEKHIRLMEFNAYGKKGKYCICALTWGNRDKMPIFLAKDNLTPKALKDAFTKAGIQVHDTKAYRNKLYEVILAHLIKCCTPQEIYLSEGWNKKDGVWVFVENSTATMRGMLKNAR